LSQSILTIFTMTSSLLMLFLQKQEPIWHSACYPLFLIGQIQFCMSGHGAKKLQT